MEPNDPLSQLRDIHLPDAVGWWPLAPGWWILAALFLAAIFVLVLWIIRRHRANRYRVQALIEMEKIWSEYQTQGDIARYLELMPQLLRRTAITAYPNLKKVSTLFGVDWLQFLDQTSNSKNFQNGAGKLLITLPYQGIGSRTADSKNIDSENIGKKSITKTDSHTQHKKDIDNLHACVTEWMQSHQRISQKKAKPLEVQHAAV